MKPVDSGIGPGVGPDELGQHVERVAEVGLAGRKGADGVGGIGDDVRFVDRNPIVDQIRQRRDRRLDEPFEDGRRVRVEPAARLLEPGGVGEVVQRHHRPQPPTTRPLEDLTVGGQRRVVDLPR
jgi:hypothetical protein